MIGVNLDLDKKATEMTDEQVDEINAHAAKHLKRALKRLDKATMSEEEFLGKCYAYMIAAEAIGWNVSKMCLVAVDRAQALKDKVKDAD